MYRPMPLNDYCVLPFMNLLFENEIVDNYANLFTIVNISTQQP